MIAPPRGSPDAICVCCHTLISLLVTVRLDISFQLLEVDLRRRVFRRAVTQRLEQPLGVVEAEVTTESHRQHPGLSFIRREPYNGVRPYCSSMSCISSGFREIWPASLSYMTVQSDQLASPLAAQHTTEISPAHPGLTREAPGGSLMKVFFACPCLNHFDLSFFLPLVFTAPVFFSLAFSDR